MTFVFGFRFCVKQMYRPQNEKKPLIALAGWGV